MSPRPSAIGAMAAEPSRAGLILDFDGVLAPIVEDPGASAMPDQVAVVLGRLAAALGLVAIISGRPVTFLEERVRVPGVPLLGSYGIERSGDGERRMEPAAVRWLAAVHRATARLYDLLADWPGIRIEEKSVSVAVHWRQAPDRDVAAVRVHQVAAGIASETGLHLEPGKLVEELRPPIAVDKGSAVATLLSARPDLAVVAYAGDDLGDLPALRAVRAAAGGYALVVDHGAETDHRLLAAADETFPGTGAFAAWLAELAGAVTAG